MLADWVAAGQASDAFWDATPREVVAAQQGLKRRLDHERNMALITGWVTGIQVARTNAGQEPVELAELFDMFDPKPPRQQTAAEMIGAMRVWVVATGGTLATATPAAE